MLTRAHSQSGKNAAEYPELALPEPNALIPQDLEVKNKVKADKVRSLSLPKSLSLGLDDGD